MKTILGCLLASILLTCGNIVSADMYYPTRTHDVDTCIQFKSEDKDQTIFIVQKYDFYNQGYFSGAAKVKSYIQDRNVCKESLFLEEFVKGDGYSYTSDYYVIPTVAISSNILSAIQQKSGYTGDITQILSGAIPLKLTEVSSVVKNDNPLTKQTITIYVNAHEFGTYTTHYESQNEFSIDTNRFNELQQAKEFFSDIINTNKKYVTRGDIIKVLSFIYLNMDEDGYVGAIRESCYEIKEENEDTNSISTVWTKTNSDKKELECVKKATESFLANANRIRKKIIDNGIIQDSNKNYKLLATNKFLLSTIDRYITSNEFISYYYPNTTGDEYQTINKLRYNHFFFQTGYLLNHIENLPNSNKQKSRLRMDEFLIFMYRLNNRDFWREETGGF